MKEKIKLNFEEFEKHIEEFFQKLIHGTIFQTETELFNKLHTLKEEFKQKLFGCKINTTPEQVIQSPEQVIQSPEQAFQTPEQDTQQLITTQEN